MMQLLDRHTQLAELEAARRRASLGYGSVVLIAGDAGVGKTALVQQVTSGSAGDTQVLWGQCDGLVLPRPLGPLRDMFPGLYAENQIPRDALDGEADEWALAFRERLVSELSHPPPPTIAVIDDAHWADEATIEAVRYLGSWISRMPVLLILTYEEDELPPDHPLHVALDDLPPGDVTRLHLEPLSRDAVATLADRPDSDELYELTGGNPFYLHEVMAAGMDRLPPTVEDAVLSRAAELTPAARACVEIAAVIPGRAERWIIGSSNDVVDEAVELGVLRADTEAVWFRHELIRRAVDASLTDSRRLQLNGMVSAQLAARDADPARVVHHAVHADDAAAVARYAPVAARQAAWFGCHREAAGHFERALLHAEHIPGPELADLLDAYSRECELIGLREWAHEAVLQAVELRETLGDHQGLGRGLRRLSEVRSALGRGPEARRAAARAVAVLEDQPPGPELVHAHVQVARLALADHRPHDTVRAGRKAIALAEDVGEPKAAIPALVAVGAAHVNGDPDDGQPLLHALTLAIDSGDADAAAAAYVALADACLLHMRYDEARRHIDDGLAHCAMHDLVQPYDMLIAARAAVELDCGQWAAADKDARQVAAESDESTATLRALWVLGLLEARRGDPSAAATLGRAAEMAFRADEASKRIPIGLAQAELAWLDNDLDEMVEAARSVLDLARERGVGPAIGQAATWLNRADALHRTGIDPDVLPQPYRWQIEGRWQDAAEYWAAAGRPYEQADTLVASPLPGPLLDALEILESLGAVPLAGQVRRRLARMNVLSVSRGPRTGGRAPEIELTSRQMEVLKLLAEDLTYRQIAERLKVSVKAIEHHLMAVRLKLGAASRNDAVATALRLGIIRPDPGET